MFEEATFGMRGHGSLITPRCPCRVLATGGELIFAHQKYEVARFTPGVRTAYEELTWIGPGLARFGEGGPTLSLAKDVKPADVFLQIDVGQPASPWCALGGGLSVDMPEDVLLLPPKPGSGDLFVEFHVPGGHHEFIQFRPVRGNANSIHIGEGEGQRFVTEDVIRITGDDGEVYGIRYRELAYEHEGATWRQRRLFVPMDNEDRWTMVVFAQAKDANAELLFGAARTIACSMEPLEY